MRSALFTESCDAGVNSPGCALCRGGSGDASGAAESYRNAKNPGDTGVRVRRDGIRMLLLLGEQNFKTGMCSAQA